MNGAQVPIFPRPGDSGEAPITMLRLQTRLGRRDQMRRYWLYRLGTLVALLLAAGAGDKWH